MLRWLVGKLMMAGIAVGASQIGPKYYEKYVGPMPPSIKEVSQMVDFNEVSKKLTTAMARR